MRQSKTSPIMTLSGPMHGTNLWESGVGRALLEKCCNAYDTDYVETIRSIERSTYDRFKQQHDPHEIMSARALGKKLGTAILANYFARMKSEETK